MPPAPPGVPSHPAISVKLVAPIPDPFPSPWCGGSGGLAAQRPPATARTVAARRSSQRCRGSPGMLQPEGAREGESGAAEERQGAQQGATLPGCSGGCWLTCAEDARLALASLLCQRNQLCLHGCCRLHIAPLPTLTLPCCAMPCVPCCPSSCHAVLCHALLLRVPAVKFGGEYMGDVQGRTPEGQLPMLPSP